MVIRLGRLSGDPTPRQIAQRCAEIRSTWTLETFYERACISPYHDLAVVFDRNPASFGVASGEGTIREVY